MGLGEGGDEMRDFISLTFCEFVLSWLSARDHVSVKLKTLPGGPGPTDSTGPYPMDLGMGRSQGHQICISTLSFMGYLSLTASL